MGGSTGNLSNMATQRLLCLCLIASAASVAAVAEDSDFATDDTSSVDDESVYPLRIEEPSRLLRKLWQKVNIPEARALWKSSDNPLLQKFSYSVVEAKVKEVLKQDLPAFEVDMRTMGQGASQAAVGVTIEKKYTPLPGIRKFNRALEIMKQMQVDVGTPRVVGQEPNHLIASDMAELRMEMQEQDPALSLERTDIIFWGFVILIIVLIIIYIMIGDKLNSASALASLAA